MSDGSNTIRVINPNDFNMLSQIKVTKNGNSVRYLNELQFANDLIYANIFMQDKIVMIDFSDGKVVGEIDISNLRSTLKNNPDAEVSNGIAYNYDKDVFYLTGKNWNKIFAVHFEEITN